jgi:integrase
LLLLVTYGLRAREITALTMDDLDWRRERLRVPERKAGHSTAYPLSPLVGEALLDYLQHGRPTTTDRHVFFRVLAPLTAMTGGAISSRAAHYLHKAGVVLPRAGSFLPDLRSPFHRARSVNFGDGATVLDAGGMAALPTSLLRRAVVPGPAAPSFPPRSLPHAAGPHEHRLREGTGAFSLIQSDAITPLHPQPA